MVFEVYLSLALVVWFFKEYVFNVNVMIELQ